MIISKPLTIALGLSICGISGYLLYLIYKKDDDDDYNDSFIKASNYKTMEIKVPKDMVRVLIGRNGKNIKAIQDQSNTKINFKERENGKVCIVRGTVEACHIAENMIQDFINEQPVIESEDVWVPKGAIGKIIGRSGENINQMSAMSGAKIKVLSDEHRNAETAKVVVTGTREQIVVAKSLIEDTVQKTEFSQTEMQNTLSKREPRLPPKANGSPEVDKLKVASKKSDRMSPFPDSPFEVYVSAMVDPSRFWVQIVGPKATQLDLLVDEMSEYYSKPENRETHLLDSVSKGDLVAAIFQFDNKWYRAEVINITTDKERNNEKLAELYYVDYGDTDTVPVGDVYELRTDFLRLHFQAIECYLANIDPAGDSWSSEAIDKFEDWTHVAQWQKLSAKINGYSVREKTRAKREGSPVPGVDLFDVRDGQEIDVAHELVANGFAVFKKIDLRPSSRASSSLSLTSSN